MNYIVTLGIRPAEMSGLQELPGKTKDRLTPLFLLAPWMGTEPLHRALGRAQKAYPGRPYFVDIDRYYNIKENPNISGKQWNEIRHEVSGLDIWWSILKKYPNAYPCLLMERSSIDDALLQIRRARENNRQFCIKIDLDTEDIPGIMPWTETLLEYLANEGASDYILLFEFAWVPQNFQIPKHRLDQIERLIRCTLSSIPTAISFTSFPKEFSDFVHIGEFKFNNRDILNQVKQRTNHPNFIYADWATTRPRSDAKGGRPPRNRIDYPTDDSWVIARDQQGDMTFPEGARRILESDYWTQKMGIWGAQQIEQAASGVDSAIHSNHKMRAVRINIHLHRQAFFGQLPGPEYLDEEWDDDSI